MIAGASHTGNHLLMGVITTNVRKAQTVTFLNSHEFDIKKDS